MDKKKQHSKGQSVFADVVVEPREQTPSDSIRDTRSQYFLEHRKELQMYLKHPEMPFTNNDCERQIREVVMDRKNYLFFQNHSIDFYPNIG